MNAYTKIFPWCLVLTMAIISGCYNPVSPPRQQSEVSPNSSPQRDQAAGRATVSFKTNVFSDGAAVPIFHGFNWADEGDNFSRYPLWLSGMTVNRNNEIQESNDACFNMAKNLCLKMVGQGFNCMRIPINYATMQSSINLERWKYTINGALSVPNFYVILCYWPDGYTDLGSVHLPFGCIELPRLKETWRRIVPAYKNNERVYFEFINEPYRCTVSNLKASYAGLLPYLGLNTPSLQHRVILAGTGVEEYVADIGDDSRFNNCLLGFHMYDFVWWMQNGGSDSYPPYPGELTKKTQWASTLINQYWKGYIKRVVITEFGCNMKDGTNYKSTDDSPGSRIGLFQAFCELARTFSMGTVYWPGCSGRDNKYSMFVGTAIDMGNSSNLQPQNSSGFEVLTSTFSNYTGNTWHVASPNYTAGIVYKLTCMYNNKVMSVRNNKWACLETERSGNALQLWKIEDAGDGFVKIKNAGTGKYLDIYGAMVYDNIGVQVCGWNGGSNQKWNILVERGSDNIVSITTKNTDKVLYGVQYLSLVRRGAWPGVAEDLCMGPFKVQNLEYSWKLERTNYNYNYH